MVKKKARISGRDRQRRMRHFYEREAGRCFWCEVPVVVNGAGENVQRPNTATLDHIIPYSQGGSNAQCNLVLCCLKCNRERGDMDAEAFSVLKRQQSA